MDLYGPPLPPGFPLPKQSNATIIKSSPPENKSASSKVIGPHIPEFLKNNSSQKDDSDDDTIGPKLPKILKRYSENSDEDICGPMPSSIGEEVDDADNRRAAIEKRASNMKDMLENKNISQKDTVEREEWMTVPDTSRRNQLGAISRCLAPGSSKPKEKHSHRHSEKDKQTSEELKKYNEKKRAKSLLEMHQKKKKKKDKEEKSKTIERKAFDREEMGGRQFTKNQVNSVIDKAKYLNSRFAPGNKHYL